MAAGDESARPPRLRICMVSDFFPPRIGGVEMHQFLLAQCLIARGHHVAVITGTYASAASLSERQGVRYLTNGLRVYYCPQLSVSQQASLHTLFGFFPLFRQILLRERIDIVHGHQTTSALAHECIMHARTMGYKAVFTDHSLFGFGNAPAIHVNKLMEFTLTDIDHVICVSHTLRENLVLRAGLDPRLTSVIPNALDVSKFTPQPDAAPNPKEQVNIVLLSRLCYRKGTDLAVEVIPRICERFPNVHFIIGGDGDKRLLVEEMRERHQLHERVELLGAVPHTQCRNVLVRGHLFLNCSLTESFCIAILEAVSCGLFVVSTRVGGVPEVLPPHMIRFAEPSVADLVEVLSDAIPLARTVNPFELHRQVEDMYSWHSVAERTERVYERVMAAPRPSLGERILKYHACGPWAGKLFCLVIALDFLVWCLLDRFHAPPDPAIDLTPDMLASVSPTAANSAAVDGGAASAGRDA
jgi:phosphatidylinositol glycan class A protein